MSGGGSLLQSLRDARNGRSAIRIADDAVTISVEWAGQDDAAAQGAHVEYAARRLTQELHGEIIELVRNGRTLTGQAQPALFASPVGADAPPDYSLSNAHCDAVEAYRHPYMALLADIVAGADRDILEIGFGLGLSAEEIQQRGARSHSIVECDARAIDNFQRWRTRWPHRDISLIEGTWQARLDGSRQWDAILFDAYPLDEREWSPHFADPVTYAHHFFAAAAAALRPGGVFTYYSNERDSMSRAHQRALFGHFDRIEMSLAEAGPISGVRKHWQTEQFLVVAAYAPEERKADG